jgi:hypothetical protein
MMEHAAGVRSSFPEYTIYAFQAKISAKGSPTWRKITSVNDEGQAIAQARDLFGKTACSRIEVHKKEPDPVTGQVSSRAALILDRQNGREIPRFLIWGITLALCALTAVAGLLVR